MKQNGFWKGFGSGLVLTVLIAALCVTATATSKRSIQVEDGIGITLNGARFTPRDAAGKQVPVFLYNGTTYVPVRAISEAMGMDVSFNSATRTVQLTTADRTASQQGASSASGNYISADRAKQIALNDAGVKEANAVFLRANLDWDDGRMKYEVEFYSGTTEYDYDIDAVTGAILSSDRELENFQILEQRHQPPLRERQQLFQRRLYHRRAGPADRPGGDAQRLHGGEVPVRLG